MSRGSVLMVALADRDVPRFAFLDFEASSLNSGSVPIEIGWVLADGAGESHLICPAFDWTDWSPASEAVHGIGRDALLRDGKSVDWVARRASEALRDWTLFADQPDFDQHWLDMLLRRSGQLSLRLRPVEHAYVAALQPLLRRYGAGSLHGLGRRWITEIQGQERPGPGERHRALPDAQRLWRTWDALRRRAGAELDGGG